MTAKERREVKRLHNRIEVLESDRQQHMTAYVDCLHTIVEMETALKNAEDALVEALEIVRDVMEKRRGNAVAGNL